MEEDEEKEGQESNGGAVAEVISGTDTWAEFARMAMRLRPLSAGEGGVCRKDGIQRERREVERGRKGGN